MLKVYTSNYSYQGPNRLDVTAKGNDPLGRTWAPTWDMVTSWKEGDLSTADYTSRYYALMRERWVADRDPWNVLLGREKTVLVCFEQPEEGFCHRFILARILCKLSAEYAGELRADGSFWGMIDLEAFADPNRLKA